jgi:hypothetical protein
MTKQPFLRVRLGLAASFAPATEAAPTLEASASSRLPGNRSSRSTSAGLAAESSLRIGDPVANSGIRRSHAPRIDGDWTELAAGLVSKGHMSA